MSALNLNDAAPQQQFGPLPAGTAALLQITFHGGGHGLNNALTKSKSSDNLYMKLECTVISDKGKGRKVWENWIVEGGSTQAINISRSRLRALVNAVAGLDPKDESPQAQQIRVLPAYEAVHGVQFPAILGVEKNDSGDQNKIAQILEPGDLLYDRVRAGETVMPENKSGAPSQPAQPAQPAQTSLLAPTQTAPGAVPAVGGFGAAPAPQPAAAGFGAAAPAAPAAPQPAAEFSAAPQPAPAADQAPLWALPQGTSQG